MTPAHVAHKTGEEYRTLRQLESRLRDVLASGGLGGAWPREAAEPFEHLRAHLVKLFALEEKEGFHAAIIRERPEKEPDIRRFQAEHRTIMTRADALMQSLRTAADDPRDADALRTRLMDHLAALRRHESSEGQLVQAVFSQDISGND
jgi:hypothetical protein